MAVIQLIIYVLSVAMLTDTVADTQSTLSKPVINNSSDDAVQRSQFIVASVQETSGPRSKTSLDYTPVTNNYKNDINTRSSELANGTGMAPDNSDERTIPSPSIPHNDSNDNTEAWYLARHTMRIATDKLERSKLNTSPINGEKILLSGDSQIHSNAKIKLVRSNENSPQSVSNSISVTTVSTSIDGVSGDKSIKVVKSTDAQTSTEKSTPNRITSDPCIEHCERPSPFLPSTTLSATVKHYKVTVAQSVDPLFVTNSPINLINANNKDIDNHRRAEHEHERKQFVDGDNVDVSKLHVDQHRSNSEITSLIDTAHSVNLIESRSNEIAINFNQTTAQTQVPSDRTTSRTFSNMTHLKMRAAATQLIKTDESFNELSEHVDNEQPNNSTLVYQQQSGDATTDSTKNQNLSVENAVTTEPSFRINNRTDETRKPEQQNIPQNTQNYSSSNEAKKLAEKLWLINSYDVNSQQPEMAQIHGNINGNATNGTQLSEIINLETSSNLTVPTVGHANRDHNSEITSPASTMNGPTQFDPLPTSNDNLLTISLTERDDYDVAIARNVFGSMVNTTDKTTAPLDRLPFEAFMEGNYMNNFLTAAITEHETSNQFTIDYTNGSISANDSETIGTWPVKHAATVEGDVVLGGLMMVHSREDTITCGPIMPQGGIQALEVMLYTLDRIHEIGLLPNISLGAHILDDCDKDTYGLEMAVDFIKGSISNIDGGEYHCNKTQVRKVISGVVGAASSVTSIQVANLLRLFRIPQVSFFSTSPELSNKQRFEYFSRTIPSDHYQVEAMVDIVRRMGWSYISIIYEESNYGIKAYEELEDLLAKNNICIAVKEKLVKDSGVAEEIAYDNIVLKLLTKPRARGAIIFGSDQEVREVMRAVRRNNATGMFSWIGSDGWSARNLVSDGNEPEVEGTLSVQPQANPVVGFEQHFLGLTVENNERNPWFVEFWEDHFECRYPNSSLTPYNKKYKKMCTTKEKLQKNTTAFEDQLQFISDAVMAFAYALSDMHKDLCRGVSGLCDAMRPTKGADLLKYLRKVNFTGLSGDRFHFNSNGDGPARYNIIHFKQVEPGKYRWIKVGEYYEGELRLNMDEVQFKSHHPKPPESVCSLPCEKGQAKKYVEGESCCWHCFNCSLYQIRHINDETQCVTCQKGTIPDRHKQYCQDIPEQYLRLESGWAIGAMAFSSTGMLITFFVVGVFLRHNDTPVVRASGRELSYVLLAGIIMCYSVTFALVLRPTDITCGIQRFCAGFCFTVVYGALLTKTNRISRIFKHGKQSAKRPSFISPRSQLVICAALTSVQVIINVIWMIISPARAMHHYPTREDNLLVCDSYVDASYMIAFSYPIVLIVICTVYAVLTRKIPEAFNESKHIGFTMYTTCVIWLAFVPLYFGTGNHVPLRLTSMSVTISLSASVTVACLFSPKLYIILIRPERNVRQSMMPVRYSAMNKTTGTGPSSMMAAIMVTAATCNQNEKLEKQTTIYPTEDANKLKVLNAGGHAEGNGCARFVEIATQTVNLTNILTNLNSSVTNSNNTSEACSEQMLSPTIASPKIDDRDTSISHNARNNNGHCITDGNANDTDDSKAPTTQIHQPQELKASAGQMIDTHVDVTMDGVLKHESGTSMAKTSIETETPDESDIGKKHAADGINGAANDLRV